MVIIFICAPFSTKTLDELDVDLDNMELDDIDTTDVNLDDDFLDD